MMNVECTKTLYRCDQVDNVCTINKVADRLGLGDGPARGHLTVRATGDAVP
jgi:hypothetical protein